MSHQTGHVSINYGVDFERAKERLEVEAGRLYRAYRAAKEAGDIQAAGEHRIAWQEAQARAGSLSRHDEAAIRAVLGE